MAHTVRHGVAADAEALTELAGAAMIRRRVFHDLIARTVVMKD